MAQQNEVEEIVLMAFTAQELQVLHTHITSNMPAQPANILLVLIKHGLQQAQSITKNSVSVEQDTKP